MLAVRLGELAGVEPRELADAYYVALLHSFGCTSDGPEQTELYGDDIEPRAAFALVDAGDLPQVADFLTTMVGRGRPPEVREAMVADALANAFELAQATFALHCEVAQRFASWLGFSPGILAALAFVFERWDGHGLPSGAAGEEIPLAARLLHVARDISVFLSAVDADEARAVVERRAGGAYDPRLAALALDHFDELLAGLDEALIWEQAIASEPPPQRWMSGDEIDAAFGVVAAFTGLKSRWLRGHAENVAELAEAAAWRLDLEGDEVARIRRAALALDLGRVGVSGAIWEKPGPFGLGDWERVRLHPYFTERAFAHAQALAAVGALAGAHHERLDGSGYHRKAQAPGLERGARILAAADCYQAMRGRRPHRPALDGPDAQAELLREAHEGRLDPDAVDAVLAAAGHHVPPRPRELPGGPHEPRARGPPRARGGAVQPGDRRDARHLGQDGRPSRAAHLREGRGAQPRRRDRLGLRALPRAHRVGLATVEDLADAGRRGRPARSRRPGRRRCRPPSSGVRRPARRRRRRPRPRRCRRGCRGRCRRRPTGRASRRGSRLSSLSASSTRRSTARLVFATSSAATAGSSTRWSTKSLISARRRVSVPISRPTSSYSSSSSSPEMVCSWLANSWVCARSVSVTLSRALSWLCIASSSVRSRRVVTVPAGRPSWTTRLLLSTSTRPATTATASRTSSPPSSSSSTRSGRSRSASSRPWLSAGSSSRPRALSLSRVTVPASLTAMTPSRSEVSSASRWSARSAISAGSSPRVRRLISRASSQAPASPSASPTSEEGQQVGQGLAQPLGQRRVALGDDHDADLRRRRRRPSRRRRRRSGPGRRSPDHPGRRGRRSTRAGSRDARSEVDLVADPGGVGGHHDPAGRGRSGRPRRRRRRPGAAGRRRRARALAGVGRCRPARRRVLARFSALARSRAPRASRKSASLCRKDTTLVTATTSRSSTTWRARNWPARVRGRGVRAE